ncbi:hypothetical protein MPSEU_000498800 [Mayamaea pseudoterrestris]|nr:hypothetical protein MPSEU_000498800 [Mayamaea pseudoterrestris]
MSNGRAASAITYWRAKQELYRLVFPTQTQVSLPQLSDSYKVSYKNLRAAYLQKLHELHPDKAFVNAKQAKALFVELRTAWETYERVCKPHRQSASSNCDENDRSDFTMFGVGCSFSDNEREKQLRSEIMDQACRGWFSSGLIAEESEKCFSPSSIKRPSLFTQLEDERVVAAANDDHDVFMDKDISQPHDNLRRTS